MRRRSELNGISRSRGALAASCSCTRPPLTARTTSAASVGSPRIDQPSPPCTRRASPQSSPALSSSPSGSGSTTSPSDRKRPKGSYPAPSTVTAAAGVQRLSTVIWFSVSVPVLSVQMTVVSPSVSTDESRRTRALRPAMRWVAIARERVTVGSRPSGMSATITPIANRKRSARLMPPMPASRKKAAPMAIARTATMRVTRSSSRSSGLRSRRVRCARAAMRPNRVCIPVAVTLASAVPAVTKVPASTRPSGSTARDSPVRADSSTRRSVADTRSASAGTRSPAASTSNSPGTTSTPSMSTTIPSRRTRTLTGSIRRSAATARSARCSCTNAKTAFTTITVTIAAVRAGSPAARARAAPAHSSSAKSCTKFARNSRTGEGPAISAMVFGPDSASRRRASSVESPFVGVSGRVRMACTEATPGPPVSASVAARGRDPWTHALHPGRSGPYHPCR